MSQHDPAVPHTPDWSDEQVRFLAETGAVLVSSLSYEQVLSSLAELAVPILGDWCAVAIVDPGQAPRRIALACADLTRRPLAEAILQFQIAPTTDFLFARVIRTGKLDLVEDVGPGYFNQFNLDPEYRGLLELLAPRAFLTVPLYARGQTRGAITLSMAESGRRFTSQLQGLATELARRASLAVDNALLFQASQRRLSELTTIQRVAQAITSALRLEQICQTAVDQLNRAFGYQMASIYLREGDSLHLQYYIGYNHVVPVIGIDQGASGRVARTGEPVFVRDAPSDPDFIYAEPDIRQCIIVPLRYGDSPVLGTIAIESTGQPLLNDDDLTLLSLLADQVSVAVVNARLLARAEEAARRFRSLVESAGSMIIGLTPDLIITEFNREAERVFGTRREQMLGQSFLDLIAIPSEKPVCQSYAQAVLTGQPVAPYESSWQTIDGTIRTIAWTLTCRYEPSGIPAELLLVGHDMTERKQAEEERLTLERRLQEAQRLESLGVLAGGIAHDFNNLLTAITGNASLLRLDLPAGTAVYQSAVEIEIVAQRAADLIRQMLVYAGRGRFDVRPLDLNSVVVEMITLLRFSISKAATFLQHLAPGLPLIEADVAQIRQVVMNLIVNASEALDAAGGTITISTGQQRVTHPFRERGHFGTDLSVGNYVTLTVSDTGIGMDEAILARIFDPFFTTKFDGRGLGLAAVLGIVRGHRGALHVQSAPGRGSTFTIFFPALNKAVSRPPAAPLVIADRHPHHRADARVPVVLVIDDEDDVRTMAVRILERGGYRTLSASDGEHGIEAFRKYHNQIAAVLLDVTMPRIGGEAVLEALRAIAPRIPVVLMSGYTADDISSRFTDPLPNGFVQKPFDSAGLLTAISQVIL